MSKREGITGFMWALLDHWRSATFKREAALLAMGYFGWITHRYFSMTDPALVASFGSAYNTLVMVVVPIIASAFGADMWQKLREKAIAAGTVSEEPKKEAKT